MAEQATNTFKLDQNAKTIIDLNNASQVQQFFNDTVKEVEARNTQALRVGMRIKIMGVEKTHNESDADKKQIPYMPIKFAPAAGFDVNNAFDDNLFFSTLYRKATIDLGNNQKQYKGSTIDGQPITNASLLAFVTANPRKDLVINSIEEQDMAEFEANVKAAEDKDFTPKKIKVYNFSSVQ